MSLLKATKKCDLLRFFLAYSGFYGMSGAVAEQVGCAKLASAMQSISQDWRMHSADQIVSVKAPEMARSAPDRRRTAGLGAIHSASRYSDQAGSPADCPDRRSSLALLQRLRRGFGDSGCPQTPTRPRACYRRCSTRSQSGLLRGQLRADHATNSRNRLRPADLDRRRSRASVDRENKRGRERMSPFSRSFT
jgi:hypothetical protein